MTRKASLAEPVIVAGVAFCARCGSVATSGPCGKCGREGQLAAERTVSVAMPVCDSVDQTEQQRAIISEPCPKCGNPEMSFYTMQLRSVDEGQTVFYSCPRCRHRYSLNT